MGIVSGTACADTDHSRCSYQVRRETVRLGVPRLNPMFSLDEMMLLCQLLLRP